MLPKYVFLREFLKIHASFFIASGIQSLHVSLSFIQLSAGSSADFHFEMLALPVRGVEIYAC